ncbi:MAG: tyrosine--tRNA ligase [Lachnospirales bacterium]
MRNVYDVLEERGFIEQTTHAEEIKKILGDEKVTFYIGFDPTADSLTVGHFLTVMAMAHLQRAGHRPIALMGGGTGMVGDPTDKTEMRKVMTTDLIDHNVSCFKKQMSKFIDFTDEKAFLLNNGDWLRELNYIDFIRTYGIHFSVNRMLTADAYKTRFEKGLTFFEFNYMLMQAYDFLELNRKYNCKLQLGGNDQWSNILAGTELIRRTDGNSAYGMTFKLLTTSNGTKMGKTQAGAVWLDPEKTSPYEFFQYWRNIDDEDTIKCLKLLTFLPMEEIYELEKLEGSDLNKAKEILAFEITKNVHCEKDATDALNASKALFSGGVSSDAPTTKMKKEVFNNYNIVDLLCDINLVSSKSEGRRAVQQGGVKINGNKVEDFSLNIDLSLFDNGKLIVQKGKKNFHVVTLV